MLFIAVISSQLGCETISFGGGISEGVIEYNISYPNMDHDNGMADLMPSKMEMKFKKNTYRNDIVAGMGLFRTSLICNDASDELTHSIKLLNKRYASTYGVEVMKKLNPDFANFSVEFTDNRKEIAGYNCKEALIKVNNGSPWEFKVYYTDEINIKSPNRCTPFYAIDGVLMEYEVIDFDTHMRFEAKEVKQQEISDEELQLEEGYEMIPPKDLEEEIEKIFAKVR